MRQHSRVILSQAREFSTWENKVDEVVEMLEESLRVLLLKMLSSQKPSDKGFALVPRHYTISSRPR